VVDGANVLAVIDAAREAFARARSGQGPTLLEILVPRLPPEEEAEASENLRDPVALFRAYLLARGDLTPQSDQQLRDEIAARLDAAERKALAAATPDPATVSERLYADDTRSQPETAREEV
jgi:TPP-dependent pyruvate/acetoin dehydrogenase alpha subunit